MNQSSTLPKASNRGLLFLGFSEMMERFSYYGTRAIIVLFAVSSNGLALSNEAAFSYYGTFSALLILLMIPSGILTDLFFKQKNAITFGSLLATAGYFTLALMTSISTLIGVLLVVIGTALMKPNRVVLTGRLFHKEDKKRDAAFLIFYYLINLGALMSGLLIAVVGEEFGYHIGFFISGMGMLLSLVLFYLGKSHYNILESDEQPSSNIEDKTKTGRIIIIVLVALIGGMYWGKFEVLGPIIHNPNLFENSSVMLGDFPISYSMTQTFNPILMTLFVPLLYIFWRVWGNGFSLRKIGVAHVLYALSLIVGYYMVFESDNMTVSGLFIVGLIALETLSELFLSPIALSYITRLSPVKFSSTIIGGYFFAAYFISKMYSSGAVRSMFRQLDSMYVYLVVTTLLIGLLLIFLKKPLNRLSKGIR